MDDRTASLLSSIVTVTFIGTWAGLAIVWLVASEWLDAATKRRWMPRYVILAGVLFVCFSTTLSVLQTRDWSSLSILWMVVPAVVVISYLNIKTIKFCDRCNATLSIGSNWFTPKGFCPKCGAKLGKAKPAVDDDLLA
jgi:hypothetical protein